jgi:hypothetical protein
MRKFDFGAKVVAMLENNPHKIGWDLPLLNELMAVASHAPDAPKVVDRILKEMDTRQISKDVRTYNLRISLYGLLRLCLSFFKKKTQVCSSPAYRAGV